MISKNIKFIRKYKGQTQQEFADFIGIKRSSLGAYEEVRANPPYEVLLNIEKLVGISVDKLLKEDLSQTANEFFTGLMASTPPSSASVTPLAVNPAEQHTKLKTNSGVEVMVVTVDEKNKQNIELVETPAHAGYLQQYQSVEFIKSLPRFALPFLKTGTYRAFQIKGESMLPLPSGSIVVGEWVEQLIDIKDNTTYIVVSLEEGIVYKRVTKQIGPNGEVTHLQLVSDNREFAPYRIKSAEVQQIWKAKSFILNEEIETNRTENQMETVMNSILTLQNEVSHLRKIMDKK